MNTKTGRVSTILHDIGELIAELDNLTPSGIHDPRRFRLRKTKEALQALQNAHRRFGEYPSGWLNTQFVEGGLVHE